MPTNIRWFSQDVNIQEGDTIAIEITTQAMESDW